MNKVLTIIIPSFNMEKYLRHCLDSLLVPNIDDVEILVINDGSTDKTSEIGHEYEARFPQSIRVIDKANGHYGSCINRGLKEATGKYVKILDADDSFNKFEFEKYVDFLKKSNTDIVFSDYCIVDDKGDITAKKTFSKLGPDRVLSFKEALPLFLDQNMAMHAVAYRTELLKRIGYKQTEGVAYTDQEWIFIPVLNVQTIAYFPQIVYKYLIGREGQSVDSQVITKAMSLQLKHFEKRINDYEILSDKIDIWKKQYSLIRMKYSMVNTFKCILFGKSTGIFLEELSKIDLSIKRKFPELYESLQNERLTRNIPFFYIKYWREKFYNGRATPMISLIKRLSNLGY